MPYNILLVEDDDDTRARLVRSVTSNPELQLTAAVGCCVEARNSLIQNIPDAVLVDLGLPDGSGCDLIREASAMETPPLCMVITTFRDESHVVEAITAGACGYLLKDASQREIVKSILDMRAGGSPISSAVARYILDHYRAAEAPATPCSADTVPVISEREQEVLLLVAKGYAYKEIAKALDISVNTVREYIRHIYRKLAVRSRGEAVFEAQAMGLLDNPSLKSH